MNEDVFSSFLIGATSSGCGKTTLSLGLMRALTRAGKSVQPYKCGPDYIDTQFHREATGLDSINLDTFMSSESHVREVYHRHAWGKDVGIVEGVMGLFDGYRGMNGSSAEIAKLLDIPVVLIVNAASTAYSVAATIYGFKNFDKGLRLGGVVFNRVSSENHFGFLKQACEDAEVECLGYMPKMGKLETPSRHLGLTLTAREEMNRFIDTAADVVEQTVDIERLLGLSKKRIFEPERLAIEGGGMRVAVARDEAFNFIYPENLDALRRRHNARIEFFSPINDKRLPEGIDLLYLPGGYPELFAKELSENSEMKSAIREYVESGGKVLAECGGMIYLGRGLDGEEMIGALPIVTTMEGAKLTLGYRTIYASERELMRGHEFHYSHVENENAMPSAAKQKNVKGKEVSTPLYRYKNLLASYTHLYWGERDVMGLWDRCR